MKPHLVFHIALFILFALPGASALQAREMRALIVGVSDYPNLDKDLWLEGPRNDAERMRDVLQQRGFSANRITVLADGVKNAGLPTRSNILGELDRLARDAGKDDFVMLYFAGHGSQQPVSRSTLEGRLESDGLYEIFLPHDAGKWSGQQGKVENALIKTELRDAVDRILAKGAFVWGIFDSCHSATLVRGADPEVRYRYVDPVKLGVPRAALITAQDNTVQMRGLPTTETVPSLPAAREGDGGSVFFYAAQTTETTPEMRLPRGQPDSKQYGLFGFTVLQALESGVPMTYRQMAQYVLTRYGAMNQTRVTPLFSGTALDQPVLSQSAPLVQQWAIAPGAGLVIQGGALSRLSEGSILAIMDDPLAKTEATIGYIKLTQVNLTTSVAMPIEYKGKPALKPAAIPKNSYARVVQIAPQYALRVGVDAGDCRDCGAPANVLRELRRKPDSVPGATITWLNAPTDADVVVKLLPDRILVLSPALQDANCNGRGKTCPQGIMLLPDASAHGVDTGLRPKLAETLHAAARTINLLRIAAQLAESGRKASQLEVAIKIVSKNGKQLPYSPEQIPLLHTDDRITITLRNNGISAVDVTMLYVDAHYGINVLFPAGGGASNRLEPWAVHEFDVDVTDDTSGIERMLTIAVDAAKGQERSDFSFLAQSSLTAVRGTNPDNDDLLAFMDAGFSSHQTRGARIAPRMPSERTHMQVFTFSVAP